MKSIPQLLRFFTGIRSRILLWYFFLSVSATFCSIYLTRQIYSDRLEVKAEASLVQEIERFKLLAEKNQVKNTTAVFDQFLSSYVPGRNQYIITLINNRIYKSKPEIPEHLFSSHPALKDKWINLDRIKSDKAYNGRSRIIYAAEPVKIDTQDATIVALYDTTSDFQAGTGAIFLVMQVMTVVLAIFFLLAWVSAGRLLSPLRLLKKTAQGITESDMTERIAVKGVDEIAELTLTFNEMLDRLQFAFDSQQRFLRDVSHELRTPITVIRGHLEMLKYQPQGQNETIALVMDELDRMGRLVNDLLLLAKAERFDFLKCKPEELDWFTEEVYLKARTLANRTWCLESKGLSPIVVDRQRLTQAIMNLVENAVRHTKDGDRITIGSSVHDCYMYFWVKDNGEGIALEDQQRIFERFVRATNRDRMRGASAYQQFEGTGLGLSIVQAIVQAHGGSIELKSHIGSGSTFTIVIPLALCAPSTSNYQLNVSRVHGEQGVSEEFEFEFFNGPKSHEPKSHESDFNC